MPIRPRPRGSVTFQNGSTVLATVPVGTGGMAQFTTSTLAVNSYTISASYSGLNSSIGSNLNPPLLDLRAHGVELDPLFVSPAGTYRSR